MKKLTYVLLAILSFSYACKKDKNIASTKVLESLAARRAEIKQKIKLHSAGLEYVRKGYLGEMQGSGPLSSKVAGSRIQTNDLTGPVTGPGGPGPVYGPITSPITTQDLKVQIVSFLADNSVPATQQLAIFPGFADSTATVVPLSTYSFKLSDNFYTIGLSIVNVAGEDSSTVKSNIDGILASQDFLNLSVIEQDILIAGAETYIDSFVYWSTTGDISWDTLSQIYQANHYSNAPVKINGAGGGWFGGTAKADAVGAVAGGIGGAISGAIAGAFAGGVGAGPGALIGALSGAIGGAVSASITHVLVQKAMIVSLDPESDITINSIDVPATWTRVALPADQVPPATLTFTNGEVVSSY